MGYIGRFAPSPTGPLHFGSLIAALGSYLSSHAAGGHWRLRIDDLDREREVPGAADNILKTLADLGFQWTGPVVYQSRRTEAYRAALEQLRHESQVYECSCSRSEIAELPYPGICRNGPAQPSRPRAYRLRTPSAEIHFADALQGQVSQNVNAAVGDFVVRRRDGQFAYQLAVVVDDAEGGITEVVRGSDLLDNTPRQILLQRALGAGTPGYAHLPLAIDAGGTKLSKSAQSIAIDPGKGAEVLWQALTFLEQSPPKALRGAPVDDLWAWAQTHWSISRLSGLKAKPAPAALR